MAGLDNRKNSSRGRDHGSLFTAETVSALVHASTEEELYRWAVEVTEEVTRADMAKFARRDGGLLIPEISTNDGAVGRDHALPVDTSIPGSALLDGQGSVIEDRADRRSATEDTGETHHASEIRHRSMLCVPVSDRGVIVALARQAAAFDKEALARTEEVTQLIVAHLANLEQRPGRTADSPIESETLEEIGRLLSHDMVNKLSIARGRLELARRHNDFDHLDECESALQGIESIAQIAATLARTGIPIDEVEPVSLKDTAAEVFGSLEPGDAELTVVEDWTVKADQGCLVQILENLFRNALDHSDGPVNIEVGPFERGFYVEDDGPGIPEGLRENVRKPGFTTRNANAGKGLTIVDRLANAHGWRMEITASSSGGARVEFYTHDAD